MEGKNYQRRKKVCLLGGTTSQRVSSTYVGGKPCYKIRTEWESAHPGFQ